jgi:uncharacterized membrane protein
VVDAMCPGPLRGSDPEDEVEETAPADAVVVTAPRTGCVQQISSDIALAVVPPGTTVQYLIRVGHFVPADLPMMRIWPAPVEDKVLSQLARSLVIGDGRTMQDDIAFCIRQIADIALRALSPAARLPPDQAGGRAPGDCRADPAGEPAAADRAARRAGAR